MSKRKLIELTEAQKAVHFETWEHINEVHKLLHGVQVELGRRSLLHDRSKIYSEAECATFAEMTPLLKHLRYGSEEYKESLAALGPALDHHRAVNRHHPEAHPDGLNGMNLLDLIEMLADWMASVKRTAGGDIVRSLEINRDRFGISDQLLAVLINTVPFLDGDKADWSANYPPVSHNK